MIVPQDFVEPIARGPLLQTGAPIRMVAVIGAGEQGRAFALRCAQAGFQTVLEDVMPAKLRQAEALLTALSATEIVHRLSFALTVEDAVREADLAIDFVPDELESKLEIFSMIDRMAPPRTILCTPTRALSISDLAACTYRAERCIAIRATGAELAMDPLVLVRGRSTSEGTVYAVRQWLEALGNSVDVVQDDQIY